MKTAVLNDALAWFEIPVIDMDRAKAFYENVLKTKLLCPSGEEDRIHVFPAGPEGISGCLIKKEGLTPATKGTTGAIVYLTVEHDLQSALDRVPGAGGSVITPANSSGDVFGRTALIMDTEGNCVGLHSLE